MDILLTLEELVLRLRLTALGWVMVGLVFLVLWLVERRTNDASLVDAGWAGSLGALAILYAALGPGAPARRGGMGLLVGAWAFRLAGYILIRHRRAGEEDPRYQSLRERFRSEAHVYFFFFYQAQGALAVILSIPFVLIAFDGSPRLHGLEVAGFSLAVVSLVGESLADGQLSRFRSNPANRGKVCRRGLWRYSRHPNYFFEWLVWCGFALAALPAPGGAIGWVSPLLILFLIVKVTGIPPSEERSLASRGDDYRRYQQATSAFVPWFPKSPEEKEGLS